MDSRSIHTNGKINGSAMRILIIDPSVKNSQTKTNEVSTIEYASVEHGMYLLRKETFDYVIFDLIYDTVERILNSVDIPFSTWVGRVGRSIGSGSEIANQLININEPKRLKSKEYIENNCIKHISIRLYP
jgi:hypothetical protein